MIVNDKYLYAYSKFILKLKKNLNLKCIQK